MKFKYLAAVALAGTALGTAANAATISGLYNSGVDNSGVATTGNGADLHWSNAFNGGSNGTFPIGPWLEETAASRWLTPTGSAADDAGGVTYSYSTTFNLIRGAGSSFTGRMAADNGAQLYLNGNLIGVVGDGSDSSSTYSTWTSFAANSGFVDGLNTLTIRNANISGPAGARIEFLSSVGAVPEPATWGMMILGFGMIGGAMRYRRRKTSVTFA